MGAPGTSYWMGSVLVFNTSSGVMSVYLDEDARSVNFGSYLGNKSDLIPIEAIADTNLKRILLKPSLRTIMS